MAFAVLHASSNPRLDEYRCVFVNLICLIFTNYSTLCQLEIWKINLLLVFIFDSFLSKLVIRPFQEESHLFEKILPLCLTHTSDLVHFDHAGRAYWITLNMVFTCTHSYSCIWHFDIYFVSRPIWETQREILHCIGYMFLFLC